MKEVIEIDNLKCGGCGNTIKKNLLEIEGVIDANAVPENGTVEVEMSKDVMQAVIDKLTNLGYPPVGTSTNMQKIKSYGSCLIGKMS